MKGRALADFIANHPCLNLVDCTDGINTVMFKSWTLIFDGSRIAELARDRIVIESHIGRVTKFSFQLDFDCSNNQAEYEALVISLEILIELKTQNVCILGDSQPVIKQLNREYNCSNKSLVEYHELTL